MRACLEVNLKALESNVKLLKKYLLKGSFFCPIIKASAYGHGALGIAYGLKKAGVKNIGVISFDEALELKSLCKGMNIYIFGPYSSKEARLLCDYPFIPVVGKWEDLKSLVKLRKKISFHLKFNTGMNRFGFSLNEVPSLIDYIKKHSLLKLEGLASHLNDNPAVSDTDPKAYPAQQIQNFKKIVQIFKKSFTHQVFQCHLFSSAGWLSLISHNQTQELSLGFRPGVCLYGVKVDINFFSESARQKYQSIALKPVSCLKSYVAHHLTISSGQPVSYGNHWITKRKTTLIIVSIGYADGLPYRLFNKGEVLFRGKRVPIAGRICMDYFMADVTDVVQNYPVKTGEEVVIFGRQKKEFISIAEQAQKTGSVLRELFTRIGYRVKRVYK